MHCDDDHQHYTLLQGFLNSDVSVIICVTKHLHFIITLYHYNIATLLAFSTVIKMESFN